MKIVCQYCDHKFSEHRTNKHRNKKHSVTNQKNKVLLHQFSPMVLLGYTYLMHTLNLKDINNPN
jgi:hypothetical protein